MFDTQRIQQQHTLTKPFKSHPFGISFQSEDNWEQKHLEEKDRRNFHFIAVNHALKLCSRVTGIKYTQKNSLEIENPAMFVQKSKVVTVNNTEQVKVSC